MIGLDAVATDLAKLAELAYVLVSTHELVLYTRWNWFLRSLSTAEVSENA